MDVMLWILIGLAGGLSVAALAPELRPPTRSAVARRRVRGMAAGLVGAVAAGYGLVLADPALRADRLTAGLGALAGALWFAGIAEAYTSRWRRDEGSVLATAPVSGGTRSAREISAYDAAREALVAGLLGDAAEHEAGRYAEIGRGMPDVRAAVARQDPTSTPRLRLALRFWGGWSEASAGGAAAPPTANWPRLARTLAGDLALDRDTSDPLILAGSDYAAPALVVREPRLAGTRLFHPQDNA